MRTQIIALWIFILVTIDQVVKLIINTFFLDSKFEIIPSLLEFKPTFNQRYSYVNDSLHRKLNIDLGLLFHIILFLFGAVVITVIYDYYKSIKKSKLLDFSFIFFIAGLLCALSGILIWEKGVLDFLYIKPFFIVDLKDIYIDCFVFLFLLYVLNNMSILGNHKTKDIILHVKKRFKQIKS